MITKLTQKTVSTLGQLISIARRKQSISQASLAERLSVTRQTVMAIEKGDPKVAVGTVFEAAYILGIPLLSADAQKISQWQTILNDFSSLIPSRSKPKPKVDNDF